MRGEVRSIIAVGKGFLVNSEGMAKPINTMSMPSLIESPEGRAYDDLKEGVRYFDCNSVVTVAAALSEKAPPHHRAQVHEEHNIS